MKPLHEWICDTCGGIIRSPDQGNVEWLRDRDGKQYGFRIVHYGPWSPRQPKGHCYEYHRHLDREDVPLKTFIGSNGLAALLAFLDVGPNHDETFQGPWVSDIREFVEFMRRVTIPYYEEARRLWDKGKGDGFFAGAGAVWTYLPDNLKRLVEEYGQ